MKKILVIGSSMTMPRNEIKYEDTWLYNLTINMPEWNIIDKSRRASTTDRLVIEGGGDLDSLSKYPKGSDLLEFYMPDLVITQIGITDCAPRLLNRKKKSTRLLDILPYKLKSKIYKLLKQKKVRSKKNSYVTPQKFNENLINYFERCAKTDTRVIVILISKPTKLVLTKNPELAESIKEYNDLFLQVSSSYSFVKCIVPFEDVYDMEKVSLDEFHINKEGHEYIYDKLIKECQ